MTKKDNNLKKNKIVWREIDVAALERMRQPDYHYINRGLTLDATPTEKAKYEICQGILRYVQENNISDQDLKKILDIKEKKKLECLLYCHINNFDLDELGKYADKLLGSFELKIVRPGEEVHIISQPKVNGRARKHV